MAKVTLAIGTILAAVCFFAFPYAAQAATLSITPSSGTLMVGDRVTVQVTLSSNVAINAISGNLSVSPAFTIESVSKAASVLNFWVSEPTFSAAARTVQFEGVALGGFSGNTGNVVSVTLRAAQEGSGAISFTSGSVLANDGQGTDITSGLSKATFTIAAATPKPAPPTPAPVPAADTVRPKPTPVKETPPPVEEPEEIPQQQPTLTAPEIMVGTKFGEQAITGTSGYSSTNVLVTFVSPTGVRVHVQGTTEPDGSFAVLVPTTLKYGTYEVHAVIIKQDLSYTPSSNTLDVTVGSIVSDLSREMWMLIDALAVVTILLIGAVTHYIRQRRQITTHMRKESVEALTTVRTAFRLLRKRGTGKTAAKRSKAATAIDAELEEAEDAITKEIKDISKL
jgi:hypothetical protein